MKISALILAKNEEEKIGGCIKQLTFVDEILLLDQNSSDTTVKIAEKLNVNILKKATGSFDKDRNILKEAANGDWLLYVDADERFEQQTIAEIKAIVEREKGGAFYFPRKNIVLGKWLKHGGWWPDYVPRLFYKKDLIEWKGPVHESPVFKGRKQFAKNPINHFTAKSIKSMLEKTTKWAKIEAQLYYKTNFPMVTKFRVTKAIIREFVIRYFIKRALLDGRIGFIQSIFQALHQAIIMVYLWEMQNDNKHHE